MYENALTENGLFDYADAVRTATGIIRDKGGRPGGDVRLLIPSDLYGGFKGLERDFIKILNKAFITIIPVDEKPSREVYENADLISAVGEVNEIRYILRRCMSEGIRFDDVEIIHTDTATYIPLIFETVAALFPDRDMEYPVTFQEGISARYSRPGRALEGMMSWIRRDHDQALIANLIQDGLFRTGSAREETIDPREMAEILRKLPIGCGRDRYLGFIETRMSNARGAEAGVLRNLKDLMMDLISMSKSMEEDAHVFLKKLNSLVSDRFRCAGEFDTYCRQRISESIEQLEKCPAHLDLSTFNIVEWTESLPASLRVAGMGPRPGCILVSGLSTGGHSGRSNTFIVGMDDGRFPGSMLQDPVLLDRERRALSDQLPTSSSIMSDKVRSLKLLMTRIRGRVTMSYSCRNLSDDAQMFSSPLDGVNWSKARVVPFAPSSSAGCIDQSEWWLKRLCTGRRINDAGRVISDHFPHMGQGMKALESRASEVFGQYDGYVPSAGLSLDPFGADGRVLSATRLEDLGRCPLEFFFKHVLGIRPPEYFVADSGRWLSPMDKGRLLHEVFYLFMSELQRLKQKPDRARDWPLMKKILEDAVSDEKRINPPAGDHVFNAEWNELLLAVRVFLVQEEEYLKDIEPVYFEVGMGMGDEDSDGQGDSDPVCIRLESGKSIRVRGRIDRIDRAEGKNLFFLWDYKTGSSRKYDIGSPFRKGRIVQPSLYLEMAAQWIERLHPGSRVVSFGYFFPGSAEHGRRMQWTTEELEGGEAVIETLCGMLAAGCFPFSNKKKDAEYSDYGRVFGNIEEAETQTKRKLAASGNRMLNPFRRLRGMDVEDE